MNNGVVVKTIPVSTGATSTRPTAACTWPPRRPTRRSWTRPRVGHPPGRPGRLLRVGAVQRAHLQQRRVRARRVVVDRSPGQQQRLARLRERVADRRPVVLRLHPDRRRGRRGRVTPCSSSRPTAGATGRSPGPSGRTERSGADHLARAAQVAFADHEPADPGARRPGVSGSSCRLGPLGARTATGSCAASSATPTTPTCRSSPGRTSARTSTPRCSTAPASWPARSRRSTSSANAQLSCWCWWPSPAIAVAAAGPQLRQGGPPRARPHRARAAGRRRCSARRSWRPRRWAERLAPEDLPDIAGFEVGRVYQAGTGLMAGDFYDVFRVAPDPGRRGHRRRHRPRHRAVDHRLPGQVPAAGVPAPVPRSGPGPRGAQRARCRRWSATEEFISLCVVVFDTEAGTLRYASAGHPAGVAVARARGAAAARHRSAADARPERRRTISREIPLDAGRPAAAVHRRPGRGPRRRPALRRGAHRQHAAARSRASTPTCCASRCSRRPGTSPAGPSPTTSPSWPSAAADRRRRCADDRARPSTADATGRGRRAGAGRQPGQGRRQAGRAGQAVRPRPHRPAARPGSFVEDALLANAVGRRPAGRRRGHRRRHGRRPRRCA